MNARIAELRRRIQKEPASIVFAQLAEEHRRAGEYEDAIRVCRAGLVHHPGYLSARVTLGRALTATGSLDDAQAELEQVLRAAPHNLGATRALEEVRQKQGAHGRDSGFGIRDSESTLPGTERLPANVEDSQPVHDTGSLAPDRLPHPASRIPPPRDPILAELESWLTAIVADRQRRSA